MSIKNVKVSQCVTFSQEFTDGTYNRTLTVWDGELEDFKVQTIIVKNNNDPVIGIMTTLSSPGNYVINRNSGDADGDSLTYNWNVAGEFVSNNQCFSKIFTGGTLPD